MCFDWYHIFFVLFIIGDACHAVVPFFGQGMNCAFEDCAVLNECMTQHGENWKQVFTSYEKSRKPNADAIADMALENFIEMRDKVNDAHFQLKKKYQALLGQKFEGKFFSRYEMVSFKTIPYSEAKAIGKITDDIAEELMTLSNDDISKIDLDKAKQLIEEKLPKMN
jgi:kynurenine 3-monooxygenase